MLFHLVNCVISIDFWSRPAYLLKLHRLLKLRLYWDDDLRILLNGCNETLTAIKYSYYLIFFIWCAIFIYLNFHFQKQYTHFNIFQYIYYLRETVLMEFVRLYSDFHLKWTNLTLLVHTFFPSSSGTLNIKEEDCKSPSKI